MKKQITKGKLILSCKILLATVVVASGVGFHFQEIQELEQDVAVLTDKQNKAVQAYEEATEQNAIIQDQFSVLAEEANQLTATVTELESTTSTLEKERAVLKEEKEQLRKNNQALSADLKKEKERPRQVKVSAKPSTSKKSTNVSTKEVAAASTSQKQKASPVKQQVASTKPVAKEATVKQASVSTNQSVSKSINGTATAYNANCKGCSGITASGKPVGPGMIAMASWVPLGTKVRVTCESYPSVNGVYTVEDRGGAIKGNKVDIFMTSQSQALDFGRRNIQIEILN